MKEGYSMARNDNQEAKVIIDIPNRMIMGTCKAKDFGKMMEMVNDVLGKHDKEEEHLSVITQKASTQDRNY